MAEGHYKASSLKGGPMEQPGPAFNVGTEVTSSCSAWVKPCRAAQRGAGMFLRCAKTGSPM